MNMKEIQKLLILLFLNVGVTFAYADDGSLADGDVYDYNTMISAHVTDMFRYGEFGTSLFTGRMQQTIPIYRLEDSDFKMNIALHYNAEGFKPRKHSGYVGYNWFLEAGGCITREVKNYPDEIYGKKAGDAYERGTEGMYHFIASKRSGWNRSKDEIFELPNASQVCSMSGGETWHSVCDLCDSQYYTEYSPDIFHFDFMGYKGSFMINNAGKAQVISGDYVEVNLSGILADWNPITPGQVPAYPTKENSTITIKTIDGYTYVFGGDLSKLEYSVSTWSKDEFVTTNYRGHSQTTNPPTINTWYLAKVTAPNGRTVTYHYKPIEKTIYWLGATEIKPQDNPLWVYNEYFDRYGYYYTEQAKICDEAMNERHALPTQEEWTELTKFYNFMMPPYYFFHALYWRSMIKTCILDSIVVSGQQPLKIIFGNSQEKYAMYNDSRYGSNCKRNYQLDAVRVISSNKVVKTAELSYDYNNGDSGSSFNWRFLRSAHISGIGTYKMEYEKDGYSFPNLYDNSGGGYTDYNPETGTSREVDDYGYYVGTFNLAMLRKMTYPTGGYQTYEYKKYKYDKKRKYSIVGDSYLEMNTVNETGTKCGVCISSVKTFDENGQDVETKTYSYEDGVFFDDWKVYGLVYKFPPAKYVSAIANNGFDMWSKDGWPVRNDAGYNLLDSHIGYGRVIETVKNSQGTFKTVYKFDMGTDSYSSRNDNNFRGTYLDDKYGYGVLMGVMFNNINLRKWGKLVSVENYDTNGNLLKSTNYEYNNIPNNSFNYIHNDVINGGTIARAPQIGGLSGNSVLSQFSSNRICTDTIITFIRFLDTEISRKLFVYSDVLTKKVVNEEGLSTTQNYSYDKKLRVTKETVTDSRNIEHFTKYTYPDKITKAAIRSTEPALSMLVGTNRINTPVETLSGYIAAGHELITNGIINLYAKEYTGSGFNLYLNKTLSLSMTEPITNYQPMQLSGSDVTYDSRYKLDAEYKFNQQGRLTSIKPFGQIETTYTWNGIYPTTKTTGDQTWKYSFIPHVGVKEIVDPRGIITRYEYDNAGRLIKESQVVDGKEQILNDSEWRQTKSRRQLCCSYFV